MVTRYTSWAYVAAVLLLTGVSTASAKYSGGTGEPNDPYQIATAADLIALGETPEDYDKHFILTADIDLDPNLPGRKVFDRAVIAPDTNDTEPGFQGTPFQGVFDGKGHRISHLTIEGGGYLGLFGQLGSWGAPAREVKNLGLVDVNITGSGGYVGGLVGDNSGSISACYTKGLVSGMNEVGGLVGSNFGTIVACYSTASVISDNGAGGLVCGNLGTVIECYSIGAVTGSWLGGGLIRYSGAPVPGAVGFVTTSFWDIQASGQGTSGGGTGETTAEMHTATTFIGWGAGPSYWTIDEGRDYPHLAWENVPGDVIAGPAYGGGTGTPGDPYLICTPEQLNMIGLVPCDLDKHFKLMADIDLSGFDGKEGRPAFNMLSSGRGEWGEYALFFLGIPFTGSLDGNGHTISHLTIVGSDYIGLFGCLGSTAEVCDLGLEAVHANGTGYAVGGIVGFNCGVVTHCHIDGSVSGGSCVGGLVGANGDYLLGESGVVTGCYSSVSVSGTGGSVGGLVGGNDGSIVSSYSTGSVSSDSSVGGLVGSNGGSIAASYSSSSVAGSASDWGNVGGLVGENWYGSSITNCYSSGSVSGNNNVGGLVGYWYGGNVSSSYSRGPVTGPGPSVGGLVGKNWYGSADWSFWDVQTSGQATSDGGMGLTTAEMQTAQTFLNAGWDFVGETANGTEDVWKIAEGLGYPRLSWQKYSGGTGEPNDPYQIATAADLIALGETPEDYDKHFVLTADIDLDPNLPGGKVFDKAVIAPNWDSPLAGVFDGDGHKISHLTIIGGSNLALFGRLGSTARVSNLGLEAVEISGTGWGIAGLVGSNSGLVTRCHSGGAVTGDAGCVGGLVGFSEGTVIQCCNAGVVSGNDYVGGLIGINHGNVMQCRSSGEVSGGDAGGLVGVNGVLESAFCGGSSPGIQYSYSESSVVGSRSAGGLMGTINCCTADVVQCYSTGSVRGGGYVGGLVGAKLNCGGDWDGCTDAFWNIETSHENTDAGNSGKTTAEMQTAATFLEAGWDFVGETDNGTEDIWKIAEGLDYPRLWWEPHDGRVTVVLGRVFTVTLESNPSTGYRWEWVDHQDSIVEQMGEAQFKPRETGDPPLVGAGGWESFDFKAVHPGQMTLKLVYRRPWEEGVEPLKTLSLQVTVP